jgi:esterase/lipase superfamily enzyme
MRLTLFYELLFLVLSWLGFFIDPAQAGSAAGELAEKFVFAPLAFLLYPVWKGTRRVVKSANTPDVYSVWYGTNRRAFSGPLALEIIEKLSFGICRIAIPKSHKFGSIGSSSFVRYLQRVRSGGADDSLHIVDNRVMWSKREFVDSISNAMGRSRDILIYVHGYNLSFEGAMIRAAQIGFDLKVSGITAAFCWASRGDLEGYAADEDTIQLSVSHFAEFLETLIDNFPDRKINIIAHSMGNRALLRVLENAPKYPVLAKARFGQIFLAAPDIDSRYFRQVAEVYKSMSDRTTLYVCSKDKALTTSGFLHANIRVGYTPPVTVVNGIDTIEVSNVNLDFLGHGYYAEASGVLYDMAILLLNNMDPVGRPRIAPTVSDEGTSYWIMRYARD